MVTKTYSFLHRNRIWDKSLSDAIDFSERPFLKFFLHISHDIPRETDVSEVKRTDWSTED